MAQPPNPGVLPPDKPTVLRQRTRAVRLSGARRLTTLVVCILCLASSVLLAQGVPAGVRGRVVRVHSPGAAEWRGHLLTPLLPAASSATVCRGRPIQCETDSSLVTTVPRTAGATIFLRTGSGATKGAIIGGAVGAGLLGAGLLIYRGLDHTASRDRNTGRVIISAAGVIGVGALIGGWIGSTHEHWEPVW